jgi:hypothetical protein
VGRARNQNGGASYTKESPTINNPLQERERKTQEMMRQDAVMLLGTRAWKGKTKDRESQRQSIEKAKARYGL